MVISTTIYHPSNYVKWRNIRYIIWYLTSATNTFNIMTPNRILQTYIYLKYDLVNKYEHQKAIWKLEGSSCKERERYNPSKIHLNDRLCSACDIFVGEARFSVGCIQYAGKLSLVQIWLVACSAPSHYLNQCWNIVNCTHGNKLQWNFNRNS